MKHQKRFQKNIMRKCGVNHQEALLLIEAGYVGLSDLRSATDEELLAIQGIEPSQLKKIRDTIGRD